MKEKNLHLVATGNGNWDYYLSKPFEDGSQVILYIAKDGSGADDGIYCGASKLRAHFYRLRQVCGGDNLIPNDWHIVDHDFFKQLGLE